MYLSDPRSTFSRIAVTTYPQMTCQGYVCQLSWLCAAKSLVFIIILLFYAHLFLPYIWRDYSIRISHVIIPFVYSCFWSCLRYWSYFILLHLGTLWPINAMVILHIKHTREKLFKVDWCMIQSILFIVLGVVELGYIVNRAGWNASLFVPS